MDYRPGLWWRRIWLAVALVVLLGLVWLIREAGSRLVSIRHSYHRADEQSRAPRVILWQVGGSNDR